MKPGIIYPLMIVIASSSYGILSTIVKLAMKNGFASSEAVTSQYLFGFLLAFILVLFTQRTLPSIQLKGWITLLFAGIFTATTGIVYGYSLDYLPASLAVVMLFQFTWMGLFLNCVLTKRLPTKIEVISLVFLFTGTILAAGVLDVDLTSIPWQGWAFGLAAALSFSIFIQINARQVTGVTTITRTFIVSAIALIVISIFLSPEIIWNGQLSAGLWKYGLALGLFGVILPIMLFSFAIPKVGGGLASILSAMELPVAILASVIVLHETLTALQFFGIVLVLIGMTLPPYLSMRKTKQKT